MDAAQLVLRDPDFADWLIVHGYPVLQRPPFIHFAHAWVESPDGKFVVLSASSGELIPRDAYYRIGQIDEDDDLFRYTREEAAKWMLKTEHYGPWQGRDA